jgi:tripeptide aminopeptidase
MIAISPSKLSTVLDQTCALQQIPGATFFETQRASYVFARMQEIGLLDIQTDTAGNVLGRWPGAQSQPPLVISAHMDTVFPIEFPLSLDRQLERITGPGIGDNSLGVASLLQLGPLLHENRITLPGDLWLAATTCEEGLGNLKGIQALTDRFKDSVVAYISLEGMGLGNILHRGLGVERYRITMQTAGGHSWVDYGALSAVHELSILASELVHLKLPRLPRTSLNIGVIKGGTSINTIAASASLELDLRSESPRNLADVSNKVNQIVIAAQKPGLTLSAERIGWRPAGEIPANHPIVQLIQRTLRGLGITPHTDIASTEANLPLSLGYPAVTIGLTIGDRAHSAQEYIMTAPLEKGLIQLVEVVQNIWFPHAGY